MKRSVAIGCVVGALVFVSGHAFADAVSEKRVAADTAEKFQAVATEVRKDMSPGGRYEFMRPDEKIKAETDLHVMAVMLQKSGSVAAMTEAEKVELFNTQENLNGILTHSDSDRLVCERRAKVGTSIPQTTCKTFGEIERARRATNDKLQEIGRDSSFCNNSHIVGCRNN
jgi:hypothetical protein